MTTTRLALLMTAGAIALGGCGGSSDQKATHTVAAVATPSQTTTAAATTATTTGATRSTGTTTARTGTTAAHSGTTAARTGTTAARTGSTSARPTTRRKAAPIRNIIIREAMAYKTTQKSSVPPVSGAKPAGGLMASCTSNNGLAQALLVQANEWRAVVALKDAPVYIDGPFLNTSQAQIAASSLNGVETVAPGGLYVVSALLTYHLDPYVKAVADCLDKAGNAPSGQLPIPKLPGT